MYIFCTDPPIEEYKRIYRNFQKLSGYKVPASNVIHYFFESYSVPYGLTYGVLTKYTSTFKTDVTEDEFLEIMVRWYHIQVTNLRGRIALFNRIDKNNNCLITCNDIRETFNETSVKLRNIIETGIKDMAFSDNHVLDFFDFLTFMFMLDPKERVVL